MEVLIITEKLLKDYSPITDDTVIKNFVPYATLVQAIYIEPVLGSVLMDELKMQVQNNNLTPLNSALILKLAPALAHFTAYQGLPFQWAKIVGKGVTLQNSENSKALTADDLAWLSRRIRNDAETFLDLAVKYLCRCKESYPLWYPDKEYCNEGCNGGTNSMSAFDGGIYFRKK